MPDVKKRLLIAFALGLIIVVMFIPIETTVIPRWKLQVVDVNGTPCANMIVTQHWGDYRLYSVGNLTTTALYTDRNGYVEFAERTVRASLSRRLIMPVITSVGSLMHGGGEVVGVVLASGIKDVTDLRYQPDNPLPDKMRVERCLSH